MTIKDYDGDGSVDNEDLSLSKGELEQKIRAQKASTQKHMAWMALISANIFTAVLFSDIISAEKAQALSNTLDWFYITQAGIVGAYMGTTTWLEKK